MAEILKKSEITKNIHKSLEIFAQENFLPLAECDFEIIKTTTYVKTTQSGTFEHFAPEILKEFLDKERVLNEHIEFSQQYHISLFKIQACTLKLNYEILFNQYKTHPTMILSANSIIPHKLYTPQELFKLLYKECNKIKAFHGVLIRVFDEKMLEQLKILVKYIYNAQFTKKVKISLYEGIEPIISQEGKLIYWFREIEAKTKSQVIEVDKNTLLLEFKKPIFGKNGLDAFGHIINVDYVTNENDLLTDIDMDSIEIQEDARSKKYIAKKQGFVHFTREIFCVNNQITLQNISRNAPRIATQEENSIEVIVSQEDTNRDSIGEGVSLKSETIHVDGFVGAKSVLEAHSLTIEGATHKDSKQFAKFAQINRHKGKLRCQHAKIALLEGGEVHATKVEVESSLGGTIYAQDVIIGHVKSNLKVYASNSISIRLISGEDNLLCISSAKIPILKSKMAFIQKELEELKYNLEEATRHKPAEAQKIKRKIEELKKDHQSIIHSYANATIEIEQPLRGLNKIIFSISTKDEIVYKTSAQCYSKFYLTIEENTMTLEPVGKTITIEN
jgi:hypothetical protein